jgi:hypothetical protein
MKNSLIYQPSGLGDILFLQKLAHQMKNSGYEVYWPVISEFKWLNEYIPHFNFVSWNDDFSPITGPPLPDSVKFPNKDYYYKDNENLITDEFFFFNGFKNHYPVMGGKYDSISMDYSDWRDWVIFNRNHKKEDKLFYDVLNISDEEDYVLINRNYMTRPNKMVYEGISNDSNSYNMKVIEMYLAEGYSMFDWCKVFENAKEINMIETSVCYMLESPELFDTMKNKKLSLHSRCGSFSEVSYLFNLPWSYQ